MAGADDGDARYRTSAVTGARRPPGDGPWDRAAFWLCVALVLMFSQGWVTLWTGPGPGPVDPSISTAARNLFYPVYLAILGLAAARPQATALAVLRAPALTLLVLVTAASMAWTIDADTTSRRVVSIALTTLAGVMLAARYPWPRLLEVFATAFAILVAASFVYALAFPTYGRMIVDFPGAWRGVWGHKNLLGYNMSVGFMLFAAAAIARPRRRWLWLAAAAAAFVLIVMSTSKTSLLSCLVGAACVALVALARRGPVGAVAATYVALTGLAGLGFLVYAAPDLLFGLLGKDSSFTGRTTIWAAVMRQIAKRPWTGFGYGAVWDSTSLWGPLPEISKEQGFVIHEAHNTWLGLWLELGYLGLGAWALLFVGVWLRTAAAAFTRPVAYFALPFLAVFSLHTLTESVALMQNDLMWVIFSALAVKLAVADPADARPRTAPVAAPHPPPGLRRREGWTGAPHLA